jgi:hypothetical protein
MDRRRFLLGTLATGLSFFAKEIFLPTTEFDLSTQLRKLWQGSMSYLQKSKVAYANKEGLWEMPGIAKVTRLSPGVMEFKCQALECVRFDTWTGLAFIDPEGCVIKKHSPFSSSVSTMKGDKLIATYTLRIIRNENVATPVG